MNPKIVLRASLVSIPLASISYWLLNLLADFFMGGIATVRGFPIPWYRDVWATEGVEYNLPFVQILNFLIFYLVITFPLYVHFNNKKSKRTI